MTRKEGMAAGCIVPHPPLLVPAIGGRDLEKVRSTRRAMEALARRLAELAPRVLVMISPHTPMYRDSFTVKGSPELTGSFAAFGQPGVRISKRNDLELVEALLRVAGEEGLPLAPVSARPSRWLEGGEELDHGLLVPLYYLDQAFETPVVSLSISGLSYQDHFQLGRAAARACEELGRRAVFVASGDLSHRLLRGAPAGYSPRGAEFDSRILDIAAGGDFDSLRDIPEDLVEEAGECGFRSIHALWGALKDGDMVNEVLSYEGPFGVGYLVSLHTRVS
ncbi:MAG: class III extradiol dioxygenase subunit B-like domain-containing protein [Actinomycetota bacterium]|nr:class III extradiol dioxygenase subunit B-like domain-containing protein [Actinomycetota bacterium]